MFGNVPTRAASLDAAAGAGSGSQLRQTEHRLSAIFLLFPDSHARGVLLCSSRASETADAVRSLLRAFPCRLLRVVVSEYPDNDDQSSMNLLGLRGGSTGVVVFYSMASPGVGHAAHLLCIPFSDLVTVNTYVFKEGQNVIPTYSGERCIAVCEFHEEDTVDGDEQDAPPLRQLDHLVPVGPSICQL